MGKKLLGVEKYIDERVLVEIAWLDKRAKQNKNTWLFIGMVMFSINAFISVVGSIGVIPIAYIGQVCAALSFCAVVLQTVDNFLQPKAVWKNYRVMAEKGKRLLNLFLTQSGDFKKMDDLTAFNCFVEDFENILQTDLARFQQNDDEEKAEDVERAALF